MSTQQVDPQDDGSATYAGVKRGCPACIANRGEKPRLHTDAEIYEFHPEIRGQEYLGRAQ